MEEFLKSEFGLYTVLMMVFVPTIFVLFLDYKEQWEHNRRKKKKKLAKLAKSK